VSYNTKLAPPKRSGPVQGCSATLRPRFCLLTAETYCSVCQIVPGQVDIWQNATAQSKSTKQGLRYAEQSCKYVAGVGEVCSINSHPKVQQTASESNLLGGAPDDALHSVWNVWGEKKLRIQGGEGVCVNSIILIVSGYTRSLKTSNKPTRYHPEQ